MLAGFSSQHCVCLTDGYLNPAEFRAALAKLRVPVPLAVLTALAGSADLSRGRPLSDAQCLHFIDVQRDSLMSVFHQFDVGRDGSITENDLKLARASLGLKISDDDIKQLIRKVDKNHSGAVVRVIKLLSLKAFGPVVLVWFRWVHCVICAGIRRVLLDAALGRLYSCRWCV